MPFFGGGGSAASNMVGATSSTAGTAGLVPAPAAGKNTRALFSDASFGEIPLLPKYKNTSANIWINVFSPGGGSGSTGLSAKVRAFYLIYVPSDGNIDTLGYRVTIAPTVTAFNLHVALWEMNENGTVGSYVIGGTGSSGLANSTRISISIASTPIKQGFYWISGTSDIATSPATITVSAAAAGSPYLSFLGGNFTGEGGGNWVTWNYTATTYNQTTHETFALSSPSGWGAQLPSLAFQYV
jgi:hypothetical protein